MRGLVLLHLALLLPLPAWAQGQGESADIELLQPTFLAGGLPGVEGGPAPRTGTLDLGAFLQYSRDPLLLWSLQEDAEAGTVVTHRWSTVLGARLQASEAFAVRARAPLLVQWGTELPSYAGDGVGTGDLGLGGELHLLRDDYARAGLAGDVLLPTAPRGAWMGEAAPRTRLAAFGGVSGGRLGAQADLGLDLRAPVDGGERFYLGRRLSADLGLRRSLDDAGRMALFSSLLARWPLGPEAPQARAAEVLAGAQLQPGEGTWTLDLGLGRGLTQGYGTSAFRTFATLSWHRPGAEPELEAVVLFEPPDPDASLVREPRPEPDEAPEEEADMGWGEDELARIEGERIVIRDPIQFEFDTARILPESLPVLHQVATLLADNPQIAHLVVEGHASEEGTHVYNYDLSIRRARAVWEQLVAGGVNPDRLSYRGMGEVLPVTEGQSEGELAASRRVEFHIVRELHPLEPAPAYREGTPLPWRAPAEAETEEGGSVEP